MKSIFSIILGILCLNNTINAILTEAQIQEKAERYMAFLHIIGQTEFITEEIASQYTSDAASIFSSFCSQTINSRLKCSNTQEWLIRIIGIKQRLKTWQFSECLYTINTEEQSASLEYTVLLDSIFPSYTVQKKIYFDEGNLIYKIESQSELISNPTL